MVCSKCGQSGHNARSCGKQAEASPTIASALVEAPKLLATSKEIKIHDIRGFFGGAKKLYPPIVESPSAATVPTPSYATIFQDIPTITHVPAIESFPTIASDTKAPIAVAPSAEQQYIIDQIGAGHNVVADCVAGSGKTTTVLFLAQRFPDKKVLQITYNKDLKLEVREKADARGITNLEIHTYHSLCVKYYNRVAFTDGPMRCVVERNTAPICALPAYDIVVLDEVQDMTILYYWMVKKLLRDCCSTPQPLLLVLGDRYQAINQFRAADPRFITLSSQIWERPFVTATLSTSYRLTDQMAAFVNDIMLGSSRIRTVRSGAPVKYMIANTFGNVSQIAGIITAKLKEEGKNPADIFVLAPSIRSRMSPIRKLENKLVEQGIPCYYPTSDDAEIDSKVIAGKVVFCTFHQAKGRERPIVLVYSFDSTYFTFNGKDMNPLVCPNTMYVAATRAREELIVVSNNSSKENAPLQFLAINHENELLTRPYVCCVGGGPPRPVRRLCVRGKTESRTTVTDLTKHLKEHSTFLLSRICDSIFTRRSRPTCDTSITSKLASGEGMYEDVSELNGLIIPGLYERQIKKSSAIERVVARSSEVDRHTLVRKLHGETNMTAPTLVDYTKIVVMYYSTVEELLNKIAQVPRYDWLTEEAVAQCHDTMRAYIPDNAAYEEDIGVYESREEGRPLLFPKYGALEIAGRLDIVTETDVFELKCVQELTLEHKLQLLIYAWLWTASGQFATKGGRRFKLLNVRTGELWELDATSPLLREAMEILLDNKYGKGEEKPDSVFVAECLRC